MGIQSYIDDFGTGYSSLGRLHNFPISALKIDRSFIGRIGIEAGNLEIAETIVTLGQKLGVDVIAEGVETVEQLIQLKALKCNIWAGILFRTIRPTSSRGTNYGTAAVVNHNSIIASVPKRHYSMANATWTRHHILTLADFTPIEYNMVLQTAASFQEVLSRRTKKVPTLQGQVVANLFLNRLPVPAVVLN